MQLLKKSQFQLNMDLKDFIAIRGKGELFRVLSKSNKGIIVETLNEKRTKFKVQPNLQVLILNDITIYPKDGNDIYLKDVMKNLFDKEGLNISVTPKSEPNKIIELFREIAPQYDEERVYLSDMKKLFRWYQTIVEFYPEVLENLEKTPDPETQPEETTEPTETETKAEE